MILYYLTSFNHGNKKHQAMLDSCLVATSHRCFDKDNPILFLKGWEDLPPKYTLNEATGHRYESWAGGLKQMYTLVAPIVAKLTLYDFFVICDDPIAGLIKLDFCKKGTLDPLWKIQDTIMQANRAIQQKAVTSALTTKKNLSELKKAKSKSASERTQEDWINIANQY